MKALFKELDPPKGDPPKEKGYVSLEAFASEESALVKSFKSHLKAKHGNLMKAWLNGINVERTNAISKEKFVAALTAMEFTGDAEKVSCAPV